MEKLKFILKNCIPNTKYTEYESSGKRYFCIWKQWFYKPYNILTIELK